MRYLFTRLFCIFSLAIMDWFGTTLKGETRLKGRSSIWRKGAFFKTALAIAGRGKA